MRRRRRWLAVGVLLLAAGTSAVGQAPALRVVRADPAGPLTRIEDADPIRIVFSEPMVPLGIVQTGRRRPGFASRRKCRAASTGPARAH